MLASLIPDRAEGPDPPDTPPDTPLPTVSSTQFQRPLPALTLQFLHISLREPAPFQARLLMLSCLLVSLPGVWDLRSSALGPLAVRLPSDTGTLRVQFRSAVTRIR